eukprot:s5047_g4.t1
MAQYQGLTASELRSCQVEKVYVHGKLVHELTSDAKRRRVALGDGPGKSGLMPFDDKAQAIAISSSKAGFGQLGAPSGLVGLARFIVLLERGVHGPQIHLHELVDAQLDEEARSRMLFLTEATEARGYAQIYGVSSFGRSGSNCHQVLLGQKPTPPEQPQFRSIQWWPGSKRTEQARQCKTVEKGHQQTPPDATGRRDVWGTGPYGRAMSTVDLAVVGNGM